MKHFLIAVNFTGAICTLPGIFSGYLAIQIICTVLFILNLSLVSFQLRGET